MNRPLSEYALLVLLAEEPAHGYLLRQRLVELGVLDANQAPQTGAVHRALRRLEDAGLVVAEWDAPVRGPARKVYSLTTEGREVLLDEYGQILAQAQMVRQLARRTGQVLR